jgi:hypothetical protein
VTCEDCGKELTIGDWPYCPHGHAAMHVIPDDIPGGQVFENGFDEPTRFYSHSAHRAALKARGCFINAKWAGPGDQHLKRWDAPSAKSLEDARILLERGPQARRERQAARFPKADQAVTVQDGEGSFRVPVVRG